MLVWVSPHATRCLLATDSQQQVSIGRQKPIITRGPSLATLAQGLGGPTLLVTQTQERRNSLSLLDQLFLSCCHSWQP
eukprot:13659746-Ditylum_brightwellii.AAC.1